jgi:hypothetical protein
VLDWLSELGTLTRFKGSADQAKMTIMAYVKMIELDQFSIGVINDPMLRECAHRFAFFPSYQELHAALKARQEELNQRFFRLADIEMVGLRERGRSAS